MKAVFKATVKWMMPTHLFRLRPIYGLASLLFHLGILLVPLFYAGHVNLWRASFRWPGRPCRRLWRTPFRWPPSSVWL